MRRCWGAFAVSVLLHGAIGGLVLLGADDEAAREERVAPAGSWMASTVEVGMADVLGAATDAGSGRSESRAPGDGASAGLDEDQAASPEVVEGVPAMAAGEGPETPGEDPGAPTKADRTAETRRAPGENRQKAEAGDGSRAARETEASSRSGAAGEATPSRAGERADPGSSGAAAGDPERPGTAEGQGSPGGENAGFGGVEAGRRVGQLPAALTRALPAAARGDASWGELSSGRAGRWKVRAELADDGALRLLQAEEGAPTYVKRLMEVSALLLRGGQFALPAGGLGQHAFELEVWVDRVAAEGGGEPHLVRQLSSQYPTGTEPGEAMVTFNSGVRVKLRVFVER